MLKRRTNKISKQANAFSTVLLYRRQQAAQRKQAEKPLGCSAQVVLVSSLISRLFLPFAIQPVDRQLSCLQSHRLV